MTNLIDQTLTILTTPPGNLLYHLVLIFSVSSFLQAGFGFSKMLEPSQANRLRAGGLLLLLLQILLFFNSALAWQGIDNANLFLPPVDRGVITLSFIWILWLWIFPTPKRSADWTAIGLSIAVMALLVFSVSAWDVSPGSIAFNDTLLDWGWSIFYTFLLISGVLLVLIQKPSGWGLALLFLNINLIGTLAHMLWASPNSDFSAALRISLLCSYPLLPGIVFNQIRSRKDTDQTKDIQETSTHHSILEWTDLASQEDAGSFFTSLSKLISQELNACCTFWLDHSPENQAVLWGYNLYENQPVPREQIAPKNFRAISKALSKSQVTLLEVNPLTQSEFTEIKQLLDRTDEIDKLYILPVHINQKSVGGFVIVFPTSYEFTAPSAAFLDRIVKLVASFLGKKEQWEMLLGKHEALERELSAAHHHLNQQKNEINRLEHELAELDHSKSAQPADSDDRATIIGQESLEEKAGPGSESKVDQKETAYSLDKLLDQVIDENSLDLLEKNITLRLNLPANLAEISIDKNLYSSLLCVFNQLATYSCDSARENGSFQLQLSPSPELEKTFLLEMTVEANQQFISASDEAMKTFTTMSKIIESNSNIRISQSMNGNFMNLNVVLSVL